MNRLEEMQEQFEGYHNKYPEVWEEFKKLTFQMINTGRTRYSAKAIFEVIRWSRDVGGDGVSEFKICNNHIPFYARAFVKTYPEHEGFFQIKKQTSVYKVANNSGEPTPEDV